jgi:hypothetical protein
VPEIENLTPAGSISLAQELLRVTLSNCPNWQALCGAPDGPVDQPTALGRIYHEGLPKPSGGGPVHTRDELIALRPYAVVFLPDARGFSRAQDAAGGTFEFLASGSMRLRLYRNCPESYNSEPSGDANLDWKNVIGQILDDLCGLAGQEGYLCFDAIRVVAGPYWGAPQDVPTLGVWQGVDLELDWKGL